MHCDESHGSWSTILLRATAVKLIPAFLQASDLWHDALGKGTVHSAEAKQLCLAWQPVKFLTQGCCLQASPATQAGFPEVDTSGARAPATAFPLPSGLAPLKLGLPQAQEPSSKPWLSVEPVQHGSYTMQRSPSSSLHDIKLGLLTLQPLPHLATGDARGLLHIGILSLQLGAFASLRFADQLRHAAGATQGHTLTGPFCWAGKGKGNTGFGSTLGPSWVG